MAANPIYVAMDMTDTQAAVALARRVAPYIGGLKLGMEFFYSQGVEGYRALAALGLPIFLDLKLHDIPNTVGQSLKALAQLQPHIINVHASGGGAMMKNARQIIAEHAPDTWIIGVTILTSLGDDDMEQIGFQKDASHQALQLASLAQLAGLNGVVCSAHEIDPIRAQCGPDFKLIVPGLRPANVQADDQKRTMTPEMARQKGADILVIGRAITASDNPEAAAASIFEAVSQAPASAQSSNKP